MDGFSALISKVVNGRMGNTGCRDKMRAAILAKARKLGHHPHPPAVALRSGKRAAIRRLPPSLGRSELRPHRKLVDGNC